MYIPKATYSVNPVNKKYNDLTLVTSHILSNQTFIKFPIVVVTTLEPNKKK
jgi:hypothetical protein